MSRLVKSIVILDMVAMIMTAAWVLFSIYKGSAKRKFCWSHFAVAQWGISTLELVYNYVYIVVVLLSQFLNILVLIEKKL